MIVNRLKVKLTESLRMLVGPGQRTKGLNLFLTLDGTVLKRVTPNNIMEIMFLAELELKVLPKIEYSGPTMEFYIYFTGYQFWIMYCDAVWLLLNSTASRYLQRIHFKFTLSIPSSDIFNL